MAYLRHLYVSREILGSILNTIHNLYFYLELMSDIRHSIEEKNFNDLRKIVKERYDD
jgi:queuine tRNA-ribosyltransferase